MLYNTYFSEDKVGLTLKVFSRRMYSTVLFFVAVFPADILKSLKWRRQSKRNSFQLNSSPQKWYLVFHDKFLLRVLFSHVHINIYYIVHRLLAVQAKHWPGGATTLTGIKFGEKALNPTCGACPALMTQRLKKIIWQRKISSFMNTFQLNIIKMSWTWAGFWRDDPVFR